MCSCQDALTLIANTGKGNPNEPFIRAWHRDAITIAEGALADAQGCACELAALYHRLILAAICPVCLSLHVRRIDALTLCMNCGRLFDENGEEVSDGATG